MVKRIMNDKPKPGSKPAKGILFAHRLATVFAILAAILLVMGMAGQMSYKPGGLVLLVAHWNAQEEWQNGYYKIFTLRLKRNTKRLFLP